MILILRILVDIFFMIMFFARLITRYKNQRDIDIVIKNDPRLKNGAIHSGVNADALIIADTGYIAVNNYAQQRKQIDREFIDTKASVAAPRVSSIKKYQVLHIRDVHDVAVKADGANTNGANTDGNTQQQSYNVRRGIFMWGQATGTALGLSDQLSKHAIKEIRMLLKTNDSSHPIKELLFFKVKEDYWTDKEINKMDEELNKIIQHLTYIKKVHDIESISVQSTSVQ